MLKRKVTKEIRNWLENDSHALLITGVRQCGKSTSIVETLKENHCDYVEINLIRQRQYISLLNNVLSDGVDAVLNALRLAVGRSIQKDTIIFIDEVQECKEIVTIIKFLVEEGSYKYILSGSLLGIELTDLRSAPVGYMHTVDMYPMDFEEFLWAFGISDDLIQNIRGYYESLLPVPEAMHEVLIQHFYRYLMIGGMPEAVQAFIDTKDIYSVINIHEQIANEYKRDFTKYENSNKLTLIKTYDLIPAELNEKNKRYVFTDLSGIKTGFDRYENSFNWLNDAGVSIPTYNVTEYQIPLEASKKSNLFKLFLSDVGMLTSFYGSSTKMKLLQRGNEINCGAMFENVVAQELFAHGYKTYYFNNKKHGEVDFLIEYEGELLPIEVKSGKGYQTHSALSYFMSTKQFKKAIVFSNYNVSQEENIIYLPIYMIMFLRANKKQFEIEPIDNTPLLEKM